VARKIKAKILVRAFKPEDEAKLESIPGELVKGAALLRRDNKGAIVSDSKLEGRKPKPPRGGRPE